MQTLSELCKDFFVNFPCNVKENKQKNKSEMQCFENALNTFLSSGKREDAFLVYFCFCEIFNVFGNGYVNTKKLLEMLTDHEYHSGELLAKQRDHYAHSVYVFAIGLAIFAHDKVFRKAFNDFYGYLDTDGVEFLKYWGLSALFHDIGYPFQLAHEQVKNYCEEIWGKDKNNLFVSFGNVDNFISLDDTTKSALKNIYSVDFLSINTLLAYGLNRRLGYDIFYNEQILKERVQNQPKFMDHAYFSAVLLAKKLFSVENFNLTLPYLDVLTAILLHNSFNKYEANGRRPISLSEHPLSYLLILCDELQSWDRMAYGKISKRDPIAWAVKFEISDGFIKEHFIFDHYTMKVYDQESDSFKTILNKNYLEISSGEFVEKIVGSKNCDGKSGNDYEGYIIPSTKLQVETEELKKSEKLISPFTSDSTFFNLYDLAKLIHISYGNTFKSKDCIDEEFGALPLEFKLSNIMLAKSYADKLELINCFYTSKDFDLPIVTDANKLLYSDFKDNIECLCREEHVRWVKEKLAFGWKYGTDYKTIEERNQKKINKCIVPYELLTDEEKAKDLLMINGIFNQLQKLEHRVKIYNFSSAKKPKLEIAGVGHRYISSDKEKLKAEIRKILLDYSQDYNVVVRTCFACGADQLIAECALELGLTVKADIPLSYEEYILDTKADAIKNGHAFTVDDELRMRHLLAQTVVCRVVADKNHKYDAASKYIISKCDVLLALWNGVELELLDKDNNPINRGGTYDSITIAKSLGKKVHIIDCQKE